MSDQAHSRRSWPAVGAMVAAGMAGGALIAWLTGDRFFNSEASYSAIMIQHTVATVAVAVALWLTRARLWRAFAAGLTCCWGSFLVLVVLAWALNDPNPSPGGSRLPSDPPTTVTAGAGI